MSLIGDEGGEIYVPHVVGGRQIGRCRANEESGEEEGQGEECPGHDDGVLRFYGGVRVIRICVAVRPFWAAQFGMEVVGCGHMNLFNRESPRIYANRIFLAPSCSSPADRLRRNRTPSGKMLRKNPRAGFSFISIRT